MIPRRETAARRDRKHASDPADEIGGRSQPVTLIEAGSLYRTQIQDGYRLGALRMHGENRPDNRCQVSQAISCPQHIGDLILPLHFGQREI